jgi:cation transport ATPase
VTNIDSREAASTLSDIREIAHRVRQSRIYQIASLLLILWGALVLAGNIASFSLPRYAAYIWIAVNAVGIAGSFALGAFSRLRTGQSGLDLRMAAALLLFFAFGILWSVALGHFTPRQLGVFWATYFMMVYTIAGLWVGPAFVAIGLGITALTLIGYVFVDEAFELWMAFVNGGGLILGGLWMRRG